jgi:hypothetical protein
MAKTSKITKALGTVFALGAMTAANDANAQALSTGCHNADFVRATLQREGQFAVVNAVAPIPERPRNIFTTNSAGDFGYNIEQGTGDVTGKLCVRARYTDIQLNGNITGPTPRWALIGQNTAHNRWLETQRTTTDERVLLGARVLRSENGQDVRGGFMMVTRGTADNAQTMNNAGAITISFDNGEIRPTILLGNVEPVQPNYSIVANASQQVASLNR